MGPPAHRSSEGTGNELVQTDALFLGGTTDVGVQCSRESHDKTSTEGVGLERLRDALIVLQRNGDPTLHCVADPVDGFIRSRSLAYAAWQLGDIGYPPGVTVFVFVMDKDDVVREIQILVK